ncbi:MAG: hypothetical protein ACYCOO_01665 [Chitinophagaceae bacterium]
MNLRNFLYSLRARSTHPIFRFPVNPVNDLERLPFLFAVYSRSKNTVLIHGIGDENPRMEFPADIPSDHGKIHQLLSVDENFLKKNQVFGHLSGQALAEGENDEVEKRICPE